MLVNWLYSPLFLAVAVGLQQTFYVVNERDGSVMACAVLSGSTERNVLVSLDTADETAQGKCMQQSFHFEVCNHDN